jgi:protein deglycase
MMVGMRKRVLCLLVDGFEEIELVTPVDLLRRAGVEVVVATLAGELVTGRNGIRIAADALLDDTCGEDFDLLLLPGGPGVALMRQDGRASKLAREFADAGKPVAAICAAPLLLQDAGLLPGRRFTAHFSIAGDLEGGGGERVVLDGGLLTSRGAGTALDFGLALVALLVGDAAAEKVAGEVMA